MLRLRCESQDTAEEDEEEEECVPAVPFRGIEREDDDDVDEEEEEDEDEGHEDISESKGSDHVVNGDGGGGGSKSGGGGGSAGGGSGGSGKSWRRAGRRSRTKVEQQRSQELDSPSNAAVPIVEVSSPAGFSSITYTEYYICNNRTKITYIN